MHLPRILVTTFGIALLASGCSDVTGPGGQLDVTLTVSSDIVSREEPVTITISAVNEGRTPMTVNANGCPERFVVTDRTGVRVAPGPVFCQLVLLTRVLQPQERLDFSYTWDGTTREDIGGRPVPLRPGRYRLRGFVPAEGESFTSAPVAVEVKPSAQSGSPWP